MISNFLGDSLSFSIFIKLGVALLCGMIIGTERIISHKAAGMRTYALVSLGAAMFVVINDLMINKYIPMGLSVNDPLQIPSMIISGIGFMGAGIIIFKDTNVTGLTTASGLWAAAGIGMACGAGFFGLSILVTVLTLFIFIALRPVEQEVKKVTHSDEDKTF